MNAKGMNAEGVSGGQLLNANEGSCLHVCGRASCMCARVCTCACLGQDKHYSALC